MDNCIFCKIIKGELPTVKVFEDKDFLALLDINPVAHGHVLIIPKEHVVWMQEASDETVAGIFKLAKKIMNAQKKGLGCDYVHVSVAGTDIPHFHVHLTPRYLNDGFQSWPTTKYEGEEKKEIAGKIISAL